MVRAVVDRLEGSKAVLLVGDKEQTVNFPKCFLPPATKEGQYLKINIEFDEVYTKQAEDEAAKLLADLKQQNS